MYWLEGYFEDLKDSIMDKFGLFRTKTNSDELDEAIEDLCDFVDFEYKCILQEFIDKLIEGKTNGRDNCR